MPGRGAPSPRVFFLIKGARLAENNSMKKRILSAVLLAALAFSAQAARKVSDARQSLITYALEFEGVPYVFGGEAPETGFDCSGYVGYVVNNALDIQLPRSANAMYNSAQVEKILDREREPGDLIFFKNNQYADRVTHVGIYCGVYHGPEKKFEGRRVFISAVSDGARTGVQLEAVDARFWRRHFFAYGRILPKSSG